MAPITIYTDSIGMYLQYHIPDNILRFTDILFYSGLTLNELSRNLPHWGFLPQTRKVYIMVGVTDCTVLDRASHRVRLVTPYDTGLFVRLKHQIHEAERVLKREFPTVRSTFCPLYGLDLVRYNKCQGTYRYQA